MKKILILIAGLFAFLACSQPKEVPFTEVRNYFFRNDASIPADAKVADAATFESLFGAAAVMGKDGTPTPIDFEKEFVIAVVVPQTDVETALAPIGLVKDGNTLVFTYKETLGEPLTYTIRPLLLVKVDKEYETATVKLVKKD